MTWRRLFEPATGRILFVFGIAVVVGRLVSAIDNLDALVPGLIVGGAWTGAGAKRGSIFAPSRDRRAATSLVPFIRCVHCGGKLIDGTVISTPSPR